MSDQQISILVWEIRAAIMSSMLLNFVYFFVIMSKLK
jgi:hypothetical protein